MSARRVAGTCCIGRCSTLAFYLSSAVVDVDFAARIARKIRLPSRFRFRAMSWVTALWAILIGACVAMALPHLLVGLWQRRGAHLSFVLATDGGEARKPRKQARAPVNAALGAANRCRYCPGVRALRAFLRWPFLLLLTAICAGATEPKRVLIVHSFSSASPPFTVHSRAFETALVEKMGEPVDLDEVSLDMARYADREAQEGIVDYLRTRQAKWQPDLVVPIGAPAAIFVAEYRDRVFPKTPILYTSLDRRLLPAGALEKNAAYIGEIFEIPGLIEDMLQVAPGTKNIAVVVGATPLEQHWREVFRKAAEPLASRINFIYFDDLSFDQMLERSATLPPDSYIFVLLLLRDAAGVTHNADEALKRLHEVANAPINSIFEHQLGLGIVGGRLYQSEHIGKEAAAVAVRILHGEPASSFPPRIIEPLPPRYDWRELQKWNIDEKSLPAGSTIFYRSPTVWEEYRNWILAGLSTFVLQALLITGLVANLVKRHRAERSLSESEKRFQSTADAAPALIWMSGTDKLCTFFNKTWLDFTGRTMAQELGKGWADGVHAEDIEKCFKTYVDAFDARQPFSMQYRLRHHNGEHRWITNNGMPRYDAQSNFLGYIGACMDITDSIEKERALREFEERVALAADAAHLGVWELNTTTNELWMSDSARDLFQFDRETRVDYTAFQARVHPGDRESRDAAVQRAIETQGGSEIQYRILLPDGTVRWIGARARCVADERGELTRLLGVSMDLTERKHSEQLFQMAAEGSHLGVWDWDETSGQLLWDGAMREIFDIPVEAKMTLELFYSRVYPHDLELLKTVWRGAIESGVPYQLDYRVQRLNGAIRWVHARGRGYYDDKGKPLRMIGVVFDITERKLAEEEARLRRDQVHSLTRVSLLGEMTASLAHELNQPLSAIVNNATAGMQYMDKGKLNPERLRDILTDVVADGRRAYEVICNVRSAIKKGSAMRGRINVNDVVKAVTYMVQPDAAMHLCKLETSLAPELPAIEADPTQMQQVLINLVNNAVDAMHDTPPSRRTVHITTNYNGAGTVCVGVRDYGTGIPDATRERLFEQFFTTKEEGLGMGLAIVRSIVESHGGKIAAENVAGGGACFSFHLPTSKRRSE